jgi:hypothetical protein
MQRKWLLEFEVKECKKLARKKAPQRNKNQEREKAAKKPPPALTDEDREHVRAYNLLMPLASRSVTLMDAVLQGASSDSRDTGIGAWGGHIARERKLPGPLNGRDVYEQEHGCVTSPFYVKLKKKKPLVPLLDDDLNPAWDKHFVNDHQVREKGEKSENNEEYLLLKLEMQMFLSRTGLEEEDSSKAGSLSPAGSPGLKSPAHSPDHSICSSVGSSPGKSHAPSLGHSIGSSRSRGPPPMLTAAERKRAFESNYYFPKPLPEEALEEWTEMVQGLAAVAAEVNGTDTMEIVSWLKPPAAAVDIIGYLCILLGVNPDWGSAKRLLLRNIPALLHFIHKVKRNLKLKFFIIPLIPPPHMIHLPCLACSFCM